MPDAPATDTAIHAAAAAALNTMETPGIVTEALIIFQYADESGERSPAMLATDNMSWPIGLGLIEWARIDMRRALTEDDDE